MSPPRAPSAIACGSTTGCGHEVIFGNHFDKIQWARFRQKSRAFTEQNREETNCD